MPNAEVKPNPDTETFASASTVIVPNAEVPASPDISTGMGWFQAPCLGASTPTCYISHLKYLKLFL